MKKKKENNLKGFTLIELLAVIVILAVIALIAIPQVLKILNKSRLSAALDSVYGIVESAETYVSNFMLQNSGAIPSDDLVFSCSSDGCVLQNTDSLSSYELDGLDKLEFKGTKPKSGIVRIKENGIFITVTHANINGFNCKYLSGKAECSKEELPTYIKVVYLDPTDLNKSCDASNINSDTGTKEGCMKWYAYAEDSSTYTMILDHNTTAKSNGWFMRMEQLIIDTTSWDNSLNPRIITGQEIVNITGNLNWNSTNNNDHYFFDSNSHKQIYFEQGTSKYAWLFDYTMNCTTFGCNVADNNTSGYWVDNYLGNSRAWHVGYDGKLSFGYDTNVDYSVRPVITIEKSKIS